MERSGFADLPLHGRRVPVGLAERVTKLGTAITEVFCTITEPRDFSPD
jgi:hypothetical protein